MKTLRDILNVAIAIAMMSFIGLSLARIVFFLLHNYNLL